MLDKLFLDHRIRVIVADDNEIVRNVVSDVISYGLPADCSSAQGLDEAIKIAAHAPVDLALLDYNMPGMNGLDGLRRLKPSDFRHVALFSGRIPSEVIDEAIKLGVSGFLPKTLAPQALLEAVQTMCHGKKFPAQHFLGKLR